jgi:NhaP-type Na+/H+ or K+/H+ antiporter
LFEPADVIYVSCNGTTRIVIASNPDPGAGAPQPHRSVALAVILFEGGLKTPVSMLRLAFWPAGWRRSGSQ